MYITTAMSYIEADKQAAIQAGADVVLQEIFKESGGSGDAHSFLVRGATDSKFDPNNNWQNMSPKEQKLWLSLHATGLVDVRP
jgi:hypothetical protein